MLDMMTKSLRVLIIDDSEDDALLLVEELRRGGYDVSHEQVYTEAALRNALDTSTWDIILSDHSMPQFSGLVALKIVKEQSIDIPFIIVSGTMSEDASQGDQRLAGTTFRYRSGASGLCPSLHNAHDGECLRRKGLSLQVA